MTVENLAERRPNFPQRIVTDGDLQKALDWLRDSAIDIKMARERMKIAENMVKVQEAFGFKLSEAKSAEARKADARTSEKYIAAIKEEAEAFGEFEKLKALREAAALKIETWRTEQANFRGMRV